MNCVQDPGLALSEEQARALCSVRWSVTKRTGESRRKDVLGALPMSCVEVQSGHPGESGHPNLSFKVLERNDVQTENWREE